jgi:hypothetical protein
MPREFDGRGNQWSPESLLAAALADCFVLSFRAVAVGYDVGLESSCVEFLLTSIQQEPILWTRWSHPHPSTWLLPWRLRGSAPQISFG